MKIQLDYDNKIITLEDNVNLGEFFDKIKDILPEWKKWKLNSQPIAHWQNPIFIDRYPVPIYPSPRRTPYWYDAINVQCGGTTTSNANFKPPAGMNNMTGVYNLELAN